MNQTGVRKAAGERSSQIAFLRAKMEAISAPSSPAVALDEVLLFPGSLGDILPGGGLLRRQVTELNDCPALAAELIARVSAAGGFVAVVGWPELSLAHVGEEGDLSRVISVPEPGAQPWAVTGVLLEGMDLVIHYGAPTHLSPTRARPIAAKLRGGHAALVIVGPHLPGTQTSLHGEVTTYRGIGKGSGRIRGLDIEVQVRTKAYVKRGVITAGQARRLELA